MVANGQAWALELRGITKRFGAVVANDQVDLRVRRGSIHALVGENGAGKSTLMRIVIGLEQPSAGELWVHGQRATIGSPHDAFRLGIGMVHQHFMLFPSLSIAENVVLGAEQKRDVRFDKAAAVATTRALAERYGFVIDPLVSVGAVSVGIQQRVEILKTLYREANLLILDEPTAVLTPQETDDLFAILRELARDGKTIILITHKLREVMAISETITVLRNGRVVGELRTAETSPHELAVLMVGREPVATRTERGITSDEPVLTVTGLGVTGAGGLPLVDDINFTLHQGEILGIAGVAGNGQGELIEALTGLLVPSAGKMVLKEKDVTNADVRTKREAGIAHIPEDRFAYGAAGSATISDNLTLGPHYRLPLARGRLLSLGKIAARARQLVQRFGVRTPSIMVKAEALSGGNLQKVVVARELDWDAPVLIAAQPTRGVDIGAQEFIHAQLLEQRERGNAVLLVSAELSEIFALSDRILVMYGGRIVGSGRPDEFSQEQIGLLMAGVTPHATVGHAGGNPA